MALCTKCGAKYEGTNFCTQCGARLDDVSEPSDANVSYSFTVDSQPMENVGGASAVEAPEIPNFGGAVKTCFLKYSSVKGRASRSEFWNWILFLFVAIFCFVVFTGVFTEFLSDQGVINSDTQESFLSLSFLCVGVFILGAIIPTFTVFVRRLHDTDTTLTSFSGSLALLIIGIGLTVPAAVSGSGPIFIGAIVCGLVGLLRFVSRLFRRGTFGENQFGPEPLQRNRNRNKAISR